jgi:diguanylate cyclase (GGDEF)-like protein
LVDDGERFPPLEIPPDLGLANLVIQQRAPLLLRSLRQERPHLPLEPFSLGKPRESEAWLGVPMITSEHIIGVLAVASYQAEAFDESDQELLQNVATQAAIAIDNARHHAQVEEQARRDSLTQVLNHGYFLIRLREEAQHARETGHPLSLIMLDIDYFKKYNDRYGHLAGDAILRGTVQAIRGNIKHTDLVGRWGGEEFAIAMPGSDRQGARLVAERIRKTLAEMKMQDDQGRAVPVPTVSQGIATLPLDANEAIALVDLADAKLYEAKSRGRDQIEMAGEE